MAFELLLLVILRKIWINTSVWKEEKFLMIKNALTQIYILHYIINVFVMILMRGRGDVGRKFYKNVF